MLSIGKLLHLLHQQIDERVIAYYLERASRYKDISPFILAIIRAVNRHPGSQRK